MSLNVGLSFWFTSLFEHNGWMPHGGLALANSLATFLEMFILLFLCACAYPARGTQDTGWFWKGLLGWRRYGPGFMGLAGSHARSIRMACCPGRMAVGVAVYGLMVILLRVPEVRLIAEAIKRRLGKKAE
jgi:putative peptidoglycan lipid II flippase